MVIRWSRYRTKEKAFPFFLLSDILNSLETFLPRPWERWFSGVAPLHRGRNGRGPGSRCDLTDKAWRSDYGHRGTRPGPSSRLCKPWCSSISCSNLSGGTATPKGAFVKISPRYKIVRGKNICLPVENFSLLKPSYDRQIDALTSTIAEIVWRCAGGFAVQNVGCSPSQSVGGNENVSTAVVVLPQETPYVQHSVQYFQDGLTETVRKNS